MVVGMGTLYNNGDFAILYFVLLAILVYVFDFVCLYVFDFVCFIPSKSLTIMPKSLTCGYSISVPDTSVVGYHTAPTPH